MEAARIILHFCTLTSGGCSVILLGIFELVQQSLLLQVFPNNSLTSEEKDICEL